MSLQRTIHLAANLRLHHEKKTHFLLLLWLLINPSCSNLRSDEKTEVHVSCNTTPYEQVFHDEESYMSIREIYFEDEKNLVVELSKRLEGPPYFTSESYRFDLDTKSIQLLPESEFKFDPPCECDIEVLDEAPDGSWQIIQAYANKESGQRGGRYLIGSGGQYDIRDAQRWHWSSDGRYFSFIWATGGPIGQLELVSLENFEVVWSSREFSERQESLSSEFKAPWPLSHKIIFSPTETKYLYRLWFDDDEDKVYIVDPLTDSVEIKTVEHVKSVTWNEAYNQMFYTVLVGDQLITKSEDETISASVPLNSYLLSTENTLESELTHTDLLLSPGGKYLAMPHFDRVFVFACHN